MKEEAEELSRLKEERESNPEAPVSATSQLDSGVEEEELVRLAAFAAAASISMKESETNEEEITMPNTKAEKELLLDLLQRMRKVTEARLREVESELQ